MSEVDERKRPRGRPRQKALDRDVVLAEALALLDRDGPDALTMRGLAAALQVSPMALYNHVSGREDLLRGVAERLVAEVEFACEDADWRERLRFCFRQLRATILAHPGAVRLMEQLDQAPLAVFSLMDVALEALEMAGLRGKDPLRAYFLLTNFTMGQVSYEVRGPFESLDPARAIERGQLRGAGFERIESAAAFDRWDFGAAFEFGLSAIIAGLERMAAQAQQTFQA
jgi:TetR/AcrR family transcriptional regulator, tetracycline repressor protein